MATSLNSVRQFGTATLGLMWDGGPHYSISNRAYNEIRPFLVGDQQLEWGGSRVVDCDNRGDIVLLYAPDGSSKRLFIIGVETSIDDFVAKADAAVNLPKPIEPGQCWKCLGGEMRVVFKVEDGAVHYINVEDPLWAWELPEDFFRTQGELM